MLKRITSSFANSKILIKVEKKSLFSYKTVFEQVYELKDFKTNNTSKFKILLHKEKK